MLTCKMLELKGQIPEVKWNALWEDYRKFVEKKNKKVNQLETNRDEAIELVKEIKLHYQQHPTMIPSVKIDKLLSLLERGKE